jgi:hypothetical protein
MYEKKPFFIFDRLCSLLQDEFHTALFHKYTIQAMKTLFLFFFALHILQIISTTIAGEGLLTENTGIKKRPFFRTPLWKV